MLAPGEPSQGLAFQAGEVIAMGKLLNRGYAISLADLAALVRNLDVATFGKAPVKRTNSRSLVGRSRTLKPLRMSASRTRD